MIVQIYFLQWDSTRRASCLVASTRSIPEALGCADQISEALRELLKGPDDRESLREYATEIPRGTRLRDVRVTDRSAVVDFSGEFESGGGSNSMLARLYQVVYTVTGVGCVESVRILVEGIKREALSGEGVVIAEPLRRLEAEPEF